MEDTMNTRLEELLMCPVCQDIFKDPHQLPCGHSMCMGCLEDLRDHASDIPFRCPDCRAFFGPVIGVQKSYTLANIADDFRMNRKSMENSKTCVYCDCCPAKKNPAVKTCLKCEVSLCKEHVKDHLELPVFTGHPLVRPLGDLKQRKCPQHEDEVLRYYCISSRRYICNLCTLESKQLKLATEAATILRRQLTEYMDGHFKTLKQQITETTGSVKKLKEDIQHDRQKMNSGDSWISGVTVALLFLWFIVLYYAYNYSLENQTLTESLNKQQRRVHHIYSTIADLLVDHQRKFHRSPGTEAQGNLTLDVGTASCYLGVSADRQTAERVKTKLNYPSSQTRFDKAPQILSTQCFSSGTHTWEVEAEGYWDIAVAYKSIRRKGGSASAFGNNAESWSLTHNGSGRLFAYHNKTKTVVAETLNSSRVAVVVKFGVGSIIFSAVDSANTKLHEFKAQLTQPVCLGLGLYRVDPPSIASIVKVS